EYAAALSQQLGAPAGGARWSTVAIARRRASREAIETAREVIVATRRTRAGITGPMQRLLALLADADQVYAALIGLNELLEAAGAETADSGAHRIMRVLVGRLAQRAEALAQTLEGGKATRQPDLKALAEKLRGRIAASGRQHEYAYAIELLHQVSRWIDAAFENLDQPQTRQTHLTSLGALAVGRRLRFS
ncbi:MAG: hypothetical protein ACHQIO_07530, partial [Nevskiales bacterium]